MVLLFMFGGYVVTSLILLKYPTLLHRKKQVKFRPKHISHRGGAAECIENTMEAFRNAQRVGTDMFELDCQLTKDEKVVVSHDDVLTRTCGTDVKISETEYTELPLMQGEIRVDFYHNMKGRGEDRRIPLLEEVFQAFPHMPVNIDIKVDNDKLIREVDKLIRAYNREDLTVWGNKSQCVCDKLYNLNPRVPLFFPLRSVMWITLLFWTGLLPFVPLRPSLLEIPIPALFMDSEEIFNRRISQKAKLFFWVMDKLMMRPALFNHLEKRGIQTNLWVLNREKDFERAFQLGVTGVMTDRVTLLREFLDRRSLQQEGAEGSMCDGASCKKL